MNNLVRTTDEGIYIDDYLRWRMEIFRTGGEGCEFPMSSREVAAKVGISHTKWNALENGIEDFAKWETWALIYKVLTTPPNEGAESLIDPNDPQYMPPTVLLEKIQKKQPFTIEEGKTLNQDEKDILHLFGLLNETGRQTALATMKALASTSPLVDSQLVKKHTA